MLYKKKERFYTPYLKQIEYAVDGIGNKKMITVIKPQCIGPSMAYSDIHAGLSSMGLGVVKSTHSSEPSNMHVFSEELSKYLMSNKSVDITPTVIELPEDFYKP